MATRYRIEQDEHFEGDEKDPWWKWAVWIVGDGDDSALDQVDFVEWQLHPTFPNPVRRITNRQTGFRLETGGWGVFRIVARVQMRDGKQTALSHHLTLHFPDGSQNTA